MERSMKAQQKPEKAIEEINCDVCSGTGFPAVSQPTQPGRRIYPASCKKFGGKGRLKLK
jgi:hypothetical protein